VVLLAVGVLVFPMLFETQPRPLPADIPIELPQRDGQPARTAALPRNAPAVTALPPVSEPAAPATPVVPEPTPAASVAVPASEGRSGTARPEAARPAAASAVAAKADAPKVESTKVEAPKVEAPKAEVPKGEPVRPAASRPDATRPADTRQAEADRARALLEGRSLSSAPAAASAPGNGRYVVQVGAYTDAATLREVRAKVEKLGLKTYTQSIDTEAGKRTRVRVGPFATRQEADSASARLKGAGLPGNVLTL
jgi:DedD protein